MQAYETEEREKGLFTFYREQAQLEDKLKKIKKGQMAKIKQLQSEHQPLTEHISQKLSLKSSEKAKKERTQQHKMSQKQEAKVESDKKHKQFQKKLLQILEKHKYDRNKRRNLRVIMKLGGDDQIALKYHLQALMHQQNQLNLEAAKEKNAAFGQKKSNLGAFQRVALCPTNFQIELDEIIESCQSKNLDNRKLGNLSNVSSSNTKKLQKIQQMPNYYKQGDFSHALTRQFLPKIQFKLNSISNRSADIIKQKQQAAPPRQHIIKSVAGSVPLDKLNKLKSARDKSLCVESARYSQEANKLKQSSDNKIYPIFIENKSSRKYEEEVKLDKEKMFVQIIRKLKFT